MTICDQLVLSWVCEIQKLRRPYVDLWPKLIKSWVHEIPLIIFPVSSLTEQWTIDFDIMQIMKWTFLKLNEMIGQPAISVIFFQKFLFIIIKRSCHSSKIEILLRFTRWFTLGQQNCTTVYNMTKSISTLSIHVFVTVLILWVHHDL